MYASMSRHQKHEINVVAYSLEIGDIVKHLLLMKYSYFILNLSEHHHIGSIIIIGTISLYFDVDSQFVALYNVVAYGL